LTGVEPGKEEMIHGARNGKPIFWIGLLQIIAKSLAKSNFPLQTFA
jgi:hypothetical protein